MYLISELHVITEMIRRMHCSCENQELFLWTEFQPSQLSSSTLLPLAKAMSLTEFDFCMCVYTNVRALEQGSQC